MTTAAGPVGRTSTRQDVEIPDEDRERHEGEVNRPPTRPKHARLITEPSDRTSRFTATSASGMNTVERFSSKFSLNRLRHAAVKTLNECIPVTEASIAHQNSNTARGFRRRKRPEDLVAAW